VSQTPVKPFPWQSLPAISGASVALRDLARDVWRRRVASARLATVFGELFGADLEGCGIVSERVCREPLPSLGSDVQLVASDRRVQLSLHPALVSLLIGRVVDERPRVDDASQLSDTLRGAWFAIVAEVCRRTATAEPFVPAQRSMNGPLWQVDFWVRVDGTTFLGRFGLSAAPEKGPKPLHLQSALPIALPLVLRSVTSTIGEIRSLRVGDVFLFDEDVDLLKSGCLFCAPNGSRGLAVRRADDGIVFHGLTSLDTLAATRNSPGSEMDTKEDDTLQDALLDAEVEVRVELGSVTLPAHKWLSLKPGDIVSTQIPLSSPVQLRVSGQLVAEGTLVNVDGKLGVELGTIVGGSS